ncbi:latent-transforming growth factor beta-binding protein 4-like [Montipora capricornis]|uniref:latent-transforming growth factor beta-binding protein 4-like n=1 Tax=Montipora capricornis TaxID=246305 RepID=UPI0035F16AC9
MKSKVKLQIAILLLLLLLPGNACNGTPWLWRQTSTNNRPVKCKVGSWESWGSCSYSLSLSRTQWRTRQITRAASHGGTCPYSLSESRACSCRAGYTGTSCLQDINECLRYPNPCQHRCSNTYGSYTCQCYSCYTKRGTRCVLRQCRILGSCYLYGTVNPNNQCQDCQRTNKMAWTNNNALPCNDDVPCTRNDRCSSGSCAGTPFTCLSCEECHNDACHLKAGFCAIVEGGTKTCFSHGDLRPEYPCQQCDSNKNNQWTNNNNLLCSDNNLNTKDDRCLSGNCVGTSYNCLSCETHDGRGCPLKAGYCVIMTGGLRTCYAQNHFKPGNPCQWCDPSRSESTWSSREGVACNDRDQCTRGDTCQSGHCTATPFTCNSLCQYCNGNGCSLKTGFGFTNVCTCKIRGQDYNHQTVNPSNHCEWCYLYDATARANGAWSNRPAVACDDQNRCTKQDTCNSGRCKGQGYSCQSSYPPTSCIKTSKCVGDGTCREIMRASGTICRPPIDICDQPERCDGNLETCPGAEHDSINITTGSAQFTDQSFLSVISYHNLTNKLYVRLTGFSASCGQLNFQWFLLSSSSACSTESVVKGAFRNSNTRQTLTGLRHSLALTESESDKHPSVNLINEMADDQDQEFSFSFQPVTAKCVLDLLLDLNGSKATSVDGIPPRPLKASAPALATPLDSLVKLLSRTILLG